MDDEQLQLTGHMLDNHYVTKQAADCGGLVAFSMPPNTFDVALP